MNGRTFHPASMVRLHEPQITLVPAGPIEFFDNQDGPPTISFRNNREATMRAGNVILWLTGHRSDLHRLRRWLAEVIAIRVALEAPSVIHIEVDLTIDAGQGAVLLSVIFTHSGSYAVWW